MHDASSLAQTFAGARPASGGATALSFDLNAQPRADAHALLDFNDALLQQAQQLAADCGGHEAAPGRAPQDALFQRWVGPHLRHIVEHYEALLQGQGGEVDYDQRPRDRALEGSPQLAIARLAALRRSLQMLVGDALQQPLRVRTLVGVRGQWPLASDSTLARELVFAASHAVHHFALLRGVCEAAAIALPEHFGIAPSTVAHALRQTPARH